MPSRADPSFRAGDWVEVRSAEEILATLDGRASVGALPFMPEMLQYCGKRIRVSKSAHKSCDTIADWKTTRQMESAVHLEGARCDGSAHGGCQAGCLLYWKTAWLKPAGEATHAAPPAAAASDLLTRATRDTPAADGSERFRCQATEHRRATTASRWWHPAPYLRDLVSRNVRLRDFLYYVGLAAYNAAMRRLGRSTHPRVSGRVRGQTPRETLGLRPGDRVRVRPWDEIMDTLDAQRKNRGLTFDVEMIPYCERTFRVKRRVEQIVDEKTGALVRLPNDCLILEDVVCGGCLSQFRLFCSRQIYPFWREIWLRRAE